MVVGTAVKPKYILQFIIIISSLILSKQEETCPRRQKPNLLARVSSSPWLCGIPSVADGLTSNFCKKLVNDEKIINPGIQSGQMETSCRGKIKSYFETVRETQATANKIIEACKRIFISDLTNRCIELITSLEKFCFNMSTMESVVMYHIGPSTFLNVIGGLNMIVFLMEHLPNTPDPDSFIMKCFPELSGDDSTYATLPNTETQINKLAYKDNLKKYKTWWESKQDKPKVYCTCAEIIYIPAVYDKSPQGRLDDYYDQICLEDYNERNSWRESHFRAILDSNINIELLKPFLTNVASLAKFGCCTLSSSWQIKYVILATEFTSNGVSPYLMDIVEHAISTGFTLTEYNEFLSITGSDDLKYYNCKIDIFNKVLDVSKAYVSKDLLKGASSQYRGNKKFYVKNEKSVFNKHIQLFIEMMEYSNLESKGCSTLVDYLGVFSEVIYLTTWSQESITNLLEKARNQNRDIQNTYSCFHFAYETEYAIQTNNMLRKKPGQFKVDSTSPRITDEYGEVFERYRNILFEKPIEEAEIICEDEHDKYNLKTHLNISYLMKKYIFTGTQGDNLQQVFNNVERQLATKT